MIAIREHYRQVVLRMGVNCCFGIENLPDIFGCNYIARTAFNIDLPVFQHDDAGTILGSDV